MAGIMDGDLEQLEEVLDTANKDMNPRVTKPLLDTYIEEESTDIDSLFDEVLDFLEKNKCYEEHSEKYQKGHCQSRTDGSSEECGEIEEDFEQVYREIAINCFRYLGFQSLEQVNKLTIPEYELLMEALELRQVDQEYWTHWQAFFELRCKSREKSRQE